MAVGRRPVVLATMLGNDTQSSVQIYRFGRAPIDSVRRRGAANLRMGEVTGRLPLFVVGMIAGLGKS